MSNRVKFVILLIFIVQLTLVIGLLVLPPLVRALPGEYRVRLARVPGMEALFEIGETPMPTALPAPSRPAVLPQITIPPLRSTATSTPTTAPTKAPESEPDVEVKATTAPSTATPTPTLTPTPVPLPRQARIDGLTIIPQGFNNCGPANLAINLNFYDDSTTQNEAAALLKPNREDRNVSPWQIADYVNERTGLRAFVGSGGTLELIKLFVVAGFPFVVEKGYEPSSKDGWLGHYLTIFAYDDEKQEFLSMDTNLGPWDGSGRVDSYETIEYYWQQFNYTFWVIYPPDKERQVLDILGLEMLEAAKMWQNTATRAQAEIDANPENAFAWFNLGTSLTRLGELTGEAAYYENGADAFDQARTIGIPPRIVWYQFRPYIAYMKIGRYEDMLTLANTTLSTQGGRNVEEAYLYKGHALALTGDGPGAVAAYEEAVRLNKYFYPAQWALDSIIGG